MSNEIMQNAKNHNHTLYKNSKSCVSTVMIVDDHPIIRAMIKIAIQNENFELVAEADNGVDAIKFARGYGPDLIILDLSLPNLDGMDVLRRIIEIKPHVKILVFTTYAAEYYAVRCMKAGAVGFVSKKDDVGELIKAVNAIKSGYTFFPHTTINSVRQEDNTINVSDTELIKTLTDRELAVLQHLALGWSNKEIGNSLLLSNKTISTYKSRLIEKLNLKSLVHLAEFAKRNNLIY